MHRLALAFTAALLSSAAPGRADDRPNVLLVMTDNHGAWTLGCYGNEDVRTPHIDRLAERGTLFTRAFASNAVCSPTRATYLTGLLPSQHGVHCYLRKNEAQMGPDAYCTIAEFDTLPRILADAGYDCGLVGKWHLGANLVPQEGFRTWVTMPHGATSTFYGAEVIENGEVRKEPAYLTDFWTERAVDFLKKERDAPFFLFLSYNGPYALGNPLTRPARNQHAEFYADQPLPSFPRQRMHPWQWNNKDFLNNPVSIRRVAAEVSGVDDGVGRVVETLRELGRERDTLVVFVADQGWVGGQHGLWGMGDHTRPLSAFDGMLHVPTIWSWPGRIPEGRRSDVMISNYDFAPTLLHTIGLGDEAGQLNTTFQGDVTDVGGSPGRDYSPVLRGETPEWKNEVFYEFENVRAIRTAEWKYVERFPDGPHELYDLTADPGEQFNLYGQPPHFDLQLQLRARLFTFFDRRADPRFNLWKGGSSKTKLCVNPTGNRLPAFASQ